MNNGPVNDQITDAFTQTATHVIGQSSSETKSMLDTLMAETVGMAMYNAVTNQHNSQVIANATVIAACARMLKSPIGTSPAPPAAGPVISSVAPSPIPAQPAAQTLTVTGTGFGAGLIVVLMDAKDTVLATLSGSSQIQNLTSTGFTFSATFTTPGEVYMTAQMPLGNPSQKFTLTVKQPAVKLDSVMTTGPEEVTLAGSHFHPNVLVRLEDDKGQDLPVEVIGVRPNALKLAISSAYGPGPLTVHLTNPGTGTVKRSFNRQMIAVATVYEKVAAPSDAVGAADPLTSPVSAVTQPLTVAKKPCDFGAESV